MGTLWAMDDHTEGKHAVLQAYLKAWLPIMGTTQERILFVDGFAGPGEYADGEIGSPIIALKTLAEHAASTKMRAEVNFFFIEKEPARHAHLIRLVEDWRPRLPPRVNVRVEHGTFAETIGGILDGMGGGRVLIPAFVMIDPFGVGQTPMALVQRLLQNPRAEIFISVMYDFINRFKETPEFEGKLDDLFGTDAWRKHLSADGAERRRLLYDLYKSQLRAGGAKHVVHFDLMRKGRPVYAIFHATKHAVGCDKMKEAIWKIAPFGDYAFRADEASGLLFGADLRPLGSQLRQRFGGIEVSYRTLKDFVSSDACYHYSGQLKRVLRDLELAGDLEVVPGTRAKAKTFPDTTRVTLRPP